MDFLQVISPCISQDDNTTLLNPVTVDEVFNALHSIGLLKAPGPDGLHALFFQQFWTQVKRTLFDLVNDFLVNGTSLNTINHTLIALIPKLDDPDLDNHYPPISLRNVVYKIICKNL